MKRQLFLVVVMFAASNFEARSQETDQRPKLDMAVLAKDIDRFAREYDHFERDFRRLQRLLQSGDAADRERAGLWPGD
jgi:hypothetical protein